MCAGGGPALQQKASLGWTTAYTGRLSVSLSHAQVSVLYKLKLQFEQRDFNWANCNAP